MWYILYVFYKSSQFHSRDLFPCVWILDNHQSLHLENEKCRTVLTENSLEENYVQTTVLSRHWPPLRSPITKRTRVDPHSAPHLKLGEVSRIFPYPKSLLTLPGSSLVSSWGPRGWILSQKFGSCCRSHLWPCRLCLPTFLDFSHLRHLVSKVL